MKHYSVMLEETIKALEIKPDGIYVDCTLGRGGHSSAILKKLTTGKLYSFDRDEAAIKESRERLSKISSNFEIIKANFSQLREELSKRGVNKVDGILYDLGVSSPQFDDSKRGFSYRFDSKLDMRMDQSQEFNAHQLINTYSLSELKRVFFKYGEHPLSSRVAYNIVRDREEKGINTTFDLNEVIKNSLPQKFLKKKGHPSKTFFQAIRIEVNNEMKEIEDSLDQAKEIVGLNGVIVVITFHSLEDRLVKHTFKSWTTSKIPKHLPIIEDDVEFKLINNKPLVATEEELEVNNRSHSAKVRSIRRIKYV